MTNFEAAMKFISKWEWQDRPDGAYTNDPKDPGGETKFGISKRSNTDLDIQNLTLDVALTVYFDQYWTKFGCDLQAFPLAVAALDTYVQHRPSVAAKLLQDCAGSSQRLLEARRVFYLNLIGKDPSLLRFKNGWLNRMNDLSKYLAILSDDVRLHRPTSEPLSV